MNKILLSATMVGVLLSTGVALAQPKIVPVFGGSVGTRRCSFCHVVGSSMGRDVTRAIGLFGLFNPINRESFSSPSGDQPSASN